MHQRIGNLLTGFQGLEQFTNAGLARHVGLKTVVIRKRLFEDIQRSPHAQWLTALAGSEMSDGLTYAAGGTGNEDRVQGKVRIRK